jgi:hypothetical protein
MQNNTAGQPRNGKHKCVEMEKINGYFLKYSEYLIKHKEI